MAIQKHTTQRNTPQHHTTRHTTPHTTPPLTVAHHNAARHITTLLDFTLVVSSFTDVTTPPCAHRQRVLPNRRRRRRRCAGTRHVIPHSVYRCLQHTVYRRSPPMSFTTLCTGARCVIHHMVYHGRHIIHHIVYQCSPRHPPHSIPGALATSSATRCTGARTVIHHIVYWCLQVATSSTTCFTGARLRIRIFECGSTLQSIFESMLRHAGRPRLSGLHALCCVVLYCCVELMCVLVWCGVLTRLCCVKRGARPRHGCKAMAMLISHCASTANRSSPRKNYLTSCWKFQHIRY